MDQADLHTQLLNMMADLDETGVLELVQARLQAGDDPLKIIARLESRQRLAKHMVGLRFEAEVALPRL